MVVNSFNVLTFASPLFDQILGLVLDVGIGYFSKKVDDKKIRKSLIQFLNNHEKYQDLIKLYEPKTSQKLIDYMDKELLASISSRAFSPSKKDRGIARKEIIDKIVSFVNPGTDDERNRAIRFASLLIDMIRDFYKSKVSVEDWIVANEVTDTIVEEIHEVKDNITESTVSINDKLDAIKENQTFSPTTLYQLGQEKNYQEIENRLRTSVSVINPTHPLFPYFGFSIKDEHLVSVPLKPDANIRYPDKIVCQGTLMMGNHKINHIDKSTIDYADRHQLDIAYHVNNAKKLLGSNEDPSQYEAEEMKGQTLIRHPKPFPPAFPCSIKVDGRTILDYVELRTEEILDDGTYIINNKEQKNINIKVELKFNLENLNQKITYNISMLHKSSNKKMVEYLETIRDLTRGNLLEVYAYKLNSNLIKGIIDPIEYKNGFKSLDEEIDFYERLCVIEQYIDSEIKAPPKIAYSDYKKVIYISEILKNHVQRLPWSKIALTFTVDDNIRKQTTNISDGYYRIEYADNKILHVFDDVEVVLPIHYILSARLDHFEQFNNRLKYTDNGDTISLTLVAGDDNTCIHQLNEDIQRGSSHH